MNVKTEAGNGGRRGHSNMSHYDKTAEVKATARKARRADDRKAAQDAVR